MNNKDILRTILEFQTNSFNKLSRSIINENGFSVIYYTVCEGSSDDITTKFCKTFDKAVKFVIEEFKSVYKYETLFSITAFPEDEQYTNDDGTYSLNKDSQKVYDKIMKIKTLEDLQQLKTPQYILDQLIINYR